MRVRYIILVTLVTVPLALEVGLRLLLPPVAVSRTLALPPETNQPGRDELAIWEELSKGSVTELPRAFVAGPHGARLVPNAITRISPHFTSGRETVLRTNSLGLRGSELPVRAAEEFRVLLLGDSITLQEYLPERASITHKTEAALHLLDMKGTVLNGGVSGLSLVDEIALLREQADSVVPQVVVLMFYLNDYGSSWTIFPPSIPSPLRHSYLVRSLSSLLFPLTPMRGPAQLTFEVERVEQDALETLSNSGTDLLSQKVLGRPLRDFRSTLGLWSDIPWPALSTSLGALKQFLDERRIGLAITFHPGLFQFDPPLLDDRPQRRLKAVVEALEVPYLDLLPYYKKALEEGVPLFFDWCHPTERGNEVIASPLARLILESRAQIASSSNRANR